MIQVSTHFVFFLVCRSFFVEYQQTEQSKTINISCIEMSVTVATEPLCGIPLGVTVWLERGDAGINGPCVCNGEECGCWPGIWVSRPCPGEEHFTLCQLGLPVQAVAWGNLSFLPFPRPCVCERACVFIMVQERAHVHSRVWGEWLRRVFWSTLLSPPALCRLTKKTLLWPVHSISSLSSWVAMVNLCWNAT